MLLIIQSNIWAQDPKSLLTIQKEEVVLNRQTQPTSIESIVHSSSISDTNIKLENIEVTKQTSQQQEISSTAEQTVQPSENIMSREEIVRERQNKPEFLQATINPK